MKNFLIIIICGIFVCFLIHNSSDKSDENKYEKHPNTGNYIISPSEYEYNNTQPNAGNYNVYTPQYEYSNMQNEKISMDCSICNGRGRRQCSSCHGTGSLSQTKYAPNYGMGGNNSYQVNTRCAACGGSGSVYCTYCGGDGKI